MNATVPKDIVSTSTKDISAACGLFYPGTSRIQYSQALDYGYMNYTTGLDFCHNTELLGTHTCSSYTSPNLKVTFSDQTIKLGTITISDVMSKMVDACGDEGQCVTSPVSIDGELVWPGLGGEVDGETLTITPSGDYPSGMQGNLLAALNAAIGAAVNCTLVTNIPTCPNPESYCPENPYTVTECVAPAFWGVTYQPPDLGSAAPLFINLGLSMVVQGVGFCSTFMTVTGAVAGAINGVAGGAFSLLSLICEAI